VISHRPIASDAASSDCWTQVVADQTPMREVSAVTTIISNKEKPNCLVRISESQIQTHYDLHSNTEHPPTKGYKEKEAHTNDL
jgi:uncharacterized protein YhfF